MRFPVVFILTLIKLIDAKPSSVSAPHLTEGRQATHFIYAAVGVSSTSIGGQLQTKESLVYVKTDPNIDTSNSNYGSSSDYGTREGTSGVLSRADLSDNSNRGGSYDTRVVFSDAANRPVSFYNPIQQSQGIYQGYNSEGPVYSNNNPSSSVDREYAASAPQTKLNRDAFETTTYYTPHLEKTTNINYQDVNRREEEKYPTASYQGANNQNQQNFQRPANSNSNNGNSNYVNNMNVIVPDKSPILHPNQQISISIEYPTVNYELGDEYPTRAPLKRPNRNRNKERNSSES